MASFLVVVSGGGESQSSKNHCTNHFDYSRDNLSSFEKLESIVV